MLRFSCPSPSIWQSTHSAWEWHSHTNPHNPHLVIYWKAQSCVGPPLCLTLYRAPTLAWPYSGDRCGNTQVDHEMVLMNDELRLLKSFLYAFAFFPVKFLYSCIALPGVCKHFQSQKYFLQKRKQFLLDISSGI